MRQRRRRVCGFLFLGLILLVPAVPSWSQGRDAEVTPDAEESAPMMDEAPAEAQPGGMEMEAEEGNAAGATSIAPGEAETSEEPAAPGEVVIPEEAAAEKGPIRYTVKEGDTLWDITRSVWTDPFLWPKVWRNNQYIFNPDLIYPGNVILFPAEPPEAEEEVMIPEAPPEEEVAMPEEEEAPVMEEETEFEVAEAPEPAPPPAPMPKIRKEPDFALLASGGLILNGHEGRGKIVAGKDSRELLGENDIAYVLPAEGSELSVGDKLIVTRIERKVYHPKTRDYMGDLVKVLGVVEIRDVSDNVKTGEILDSFDYITINDEVIPYQDLKSSIAAAGSQAPGEGGGGYILDVKEDKQTNAAPDIVYLDIGRRDGLANGNRFRVVRQGDRAPGKEELPKRVIGSVEVLMVLDATSTARVVDSSEAILKGDRIEPMDTP